MIIRNEKERELLRESGRRLGTLLKEVSERVAPGVTLKELDEHAQKMIRDWGDTPSFLGHKGRKDKHPFPAALCTSVNNGLVHGIPSDYVIEDGDIVKLDCGIAHRGFYTDSAVTVAVGTVSEREQELINATKKALEEQIKVVRVGSTLGDIGYAAEKIAKKHNLGFPTVLGGHGVGRAVHEEPFIHNFGKPGKGEVLRKDMVIAIEPMMSLGGGDIELSDDGWTFNMKDGSKGAHFEHTVIVGDDSAEVLTRVD